MDGRALAARVREELTREIAEFGPVRLATVLVGDDPASHVYIRLKHKAADDVGIHAIDKRLPGNTSEEELLVLIEELNADDSVDGILVQTPLPPQIDEARVMRMIEPVKDVDGLHPFNAGRLFFGQETLVGATPVGVMRLLAEYKIPVAGARAVVVGRSLIVGRPLAMLLLHANATVTICHSRTEDLARHTLDADILVAAVGYLGLITEGLFGDVDPGVADVAGFLTPVPGGVGPMTIACLLENALKAARYRSGALVFPLI
jgi:methylenetetrahydrofolate dehydrogenase (NADP+)/methenyltetrahydrofolate cyclohydrolase